MANFNQQNPFTVIEENVRPFINHIYVEYLKLPDRELKVLLALKSFAWNHKDNCYPSVANIGKIIGKSGRQVTEILNELQKKGLIRIETSDGFSNTYYITNKSLTNKTTEKTEKLPAPLRKSAQSYPQPLRKSSGDPCGNPQGTPEEILTRSNISNNKKEIERGTRKKRAPLSSPFKPEKSHVEFAKQHNIDLNKEVDSFLNRFKGNKTPYEFQRWLELAVGYQKNNPRTYPQNKTDEVRCTVPEWGPGHPTWEAINGSPVRRDH